MIQNLKIKNFRCLKDFDIDFSSGLTLIVGENDAGKTSVIDVLRIIFNDRLNIGSNDFTDANLDIEFVVRINDQDYQIVIKPDYTKRYFVVTSKTELESIKNNVNDDQLESVVDIKHEAKFLASTIGATVKLVSTARTNVTSKIDLFLAENLDAETITVPIQSIPIYESYILDGKQFSDVRSSFVEWFFQDIKHSIWDSNVTEKQTIREFIQKQLDTYSDTLQQEIKDRGIHTKIREFLPSLTEIVVKSQFEARDININVDVKLLENGNEVSVDRRGDGTRRRITMALLEYKKTQQATVPQLYAFDEPDTHLHVKAQLELFQTLKQMASEGKQIIITTHSPFLINAVQPKNIRLVECQRGVSQCKRVSNEEKVEELLRKLGIENTYLFFARKLVIVEGETEETFIPIIYKHMFTQDMTTELIKVVKREGITDVPRFVSVIQEFVRPQDIFILVDSDFEQSDTKTKEIMESLKIPTDNRFFVGTKEFEDAFDAKTIFNSWKNYVEAVQGRLGPKWEIKEIEKLLIECRAEKLKFSERVHTLNQKGKGMTKPLLGHALGDFCSAQIVKDGKLDCLPGELKEFFTKLGGEQYD